ncbi:MAG: glycosyltransferase [Candidatus Bathyarchaeia archaeon]
MSDPRVEKEVSSLTSYGFDVVVLAWDREGKLKRFESGGNQRVFRFHLIAPYRAFTVILYYPIFWFWILIKLLELKPEVVHACDLDTVFPSLLYRFFVRNVKVVFDVFDTFTLLIKAKNDFFARIVRPIELRVASMSDVVVTVSEARLDFFSCVPLKQTRIIMNCPPLRFFSTDVSESAEREKVFRVVYAGAIAPYRGLLQIAEAVDSLDGVEFVVAGRILDDKLAAKLCAFSCVKYVGQLSFDDSLELEMSADVIPVLYDQKLPINRVAAPNKLYEAMLVGVPVITNLSCFLDDVPFGLQVGYDVSEIRCAIVYLQKHPEVSANFGREGRLAFEQKYNWSVMEKSLIDLYSQLLCCSKA